MTTATTLPEPVSRRSHWRLAVFLAVLLGGGLHWGGGLLFDDDSGRIPPQVLIQMVMFGPLAVLLLFTAWWVFLGPGRWWQRLIGVLVCAAVAAGAVAVAAGDKTKFVAAMWGVPFAAAVTGVAVAVTPAARWRRTVGVIAAVVGLAPSLGMRADGVDGRFGLETSYRWVPSAAARASEQLAGRTTVTVAGGAADLGPATEADWPGFRGGRRDGDVPPAVTAGWDGSPPKERWRLAAIGPAWSSFCAVGDLVFTQEKRGESESVVCYRADTGAEVWARGEPGSHDDMPSGAGPRATPTYANGMIYAVGSKGTVSCVRAATGEPVWVVKLAERFGATEPVFGQSASPLVVGDVVVVNPCSASSPRLVGLAVGTGETRWATEAKGTDGYSSPHAATIAGVGQVLIYNGTGLAGHDPATGKELWHYDWKTAQNEPTTVQPLVLPDGRVVIGGGNAGVGTRCVAVKREGERWAVEEVWKTTRFTPTFNDVVHHGAHLYGLDKGMLVCLDLATGKIVWKEGRYGSGQMVLVGNKLLVISERGRLACVAASPDGYDELWIADALNKKTWNHPAIARGRLFLRNDTEAAAFDLPTGQSAH